jgi:hypothetical protein
VVDAAWRDFGDEIARWRDAGRAVEFWLRDDDAIAPNPALERLCALCAAARVPLALAVVPRGAQPALFDALGEGVDVLQHGTDHRNRAAAGGKKTEFPGEEPLPVALARLREGRERLASLARGCFLPVLAPPWNRLPRHVLPHLRGAGLHGLSRFGARAAAEAAPGVRQVNTHVDIVDWRGSGTFAGDTEALRLALNHLIARRTRAADPDEPTGWLTHHARHDGPAWRFLERLFETTCAAPGVAWLRAARLFCAA